jgi:hypothetical protein
MLLLLIKPAKALMLKGEWSDRQTRRNCDEPKFGGSSLFLIGIGIVLALKMYINNAG